MSRSLAKQIQLALYWDLYRSGHIHICPNFTPPGWFECDMFSITKKGMRVFEHEIKISRADFKADAKKADDRPVKWDLELKRYVPHTAITKYQKIALSDVASPSKFIYVVPEGLISESEVPEWAGLSYFSTPSYSTFGVINVVKKAPKIHGAQVNSLVLDKVRDTFFYRFWNLKLKNEIHTDCEPEYSI